MKNLLYILLLILITTKTQAQITGDNYPVQAHVFVSGAGSLKLSDYFTSSTKLGVDLILKDLTKSSLDVYLSWEIEGLGLGIQAGSSPGFVPGSFISLNRGSVRKLKGIDLRAYFQPGVVLAAGVSEAAIFSGSLPEGFYVLRVRAYEAGTGREVSNRAETYFSVAYALPPVLNQPLTGSEVTVTRPQNVLLQWTPRHTSTGSNLVTYQIKVCEVAEDDEPNVAILGSQTCFTVPQQTATTYLLKASDLPLKPGKRYAWQVQATDLNGALEFQNTGNSEVAWFRYGKACNAPEDLTATEIGPNRVNLSWKADPQAMGYKVYYKNETAAEWQSQSTFGTSLTLVGLDKKEPYSFKISTLCDIDNESPTSPEKTWEAEEIDTELQKLIDAVLHPLDQISSSTTPTASPKTDNVKTSGQPTSKAATEPLPTNIAKLIPTDPTKIPCVGQVRGFENCSVTHDGVTLMGTEPLQSLAVGDPLTIYDMQAIVTEVSGGGGTYSGKALVKLPFLADMVMAVEFSNIEVKTEKPATYRGGCVTNVPANGYFRARTGLSREKLKAEEVALIDQVRKAQDPGSTYTTLGQQISQYDQTSKEIADATATGQSLSTEQKEALLAQTLALNGQMTTWLENANELIGGSTAGDAILAQIQAILDQLAANQAAIEAGTSFPSLPSLGSTITGITDQIRTLLDTPPTDTPRIQNLQATKITDKSATLTWEGDKRFTKYIVTVQKPGEGERIFVVSGEKLEVENLTNASDYVYSVVGYVGEEKTVETPQQFFSTLDNIFPKPKNIVSSKLSESSVKLTWDKDSKHLKYKLKYTDKEGNERFAYPTSNEVTLADLDPDMDYPFELFAIGAANQTASELGQFSTDIKCELSLMVKNKFNDDKIEGNFSFILATGCSNEVGITSEVIWGNGTGKGMFNAAGILTFPDGEEVESLLGGLSIVVNPQQNTSYVASCIKSSGAATKTCTAKADVAVLSEPVILPECENFKILISTSSPTFDEKITISTEGCENGTIFWPDFNSNERFVNIKFVSDITINAICKKGELICNASEYISDSQSCNFIYARNQFGSNRVYLLKHPCDDISNVTVTSTGPQKGVEINTYFETGNTPYFEWNRLSGYKSTVAITLGCSNNDCKEEFIAQYGNTNSCFKKNISVEYAAYTSERVLTLEGCKGEVKWNNTSISPNFVFTYNPTSLYTDVTVTCTENKGKSNERVCNYQYQPLNPYNTIPNLRIKYNQVELPYEVNNHNLNAISWPESGKITKGDVPLGLTSPLGIKPGNKYYFFSSQCETATWKYQDGSVIPTIRFIDNVCCNPENDPVKNALYINGSNFSPGIYQISCVTKSGIVLTENMYLYPISTGTCLNASVLSTKIKAGQSTKLYANCIEKVKWFVDDEEIGSGTDFSVQPLQTTTYTATCTEPNCSEDLTIEVEPCQLQITSSKGQSLKVLQPTTLKLTGCLGEVIWRQDNEILNSETNSIEVKPTQTATYTANCLGGECDAKIELKVESTPPPPIICEELKLLPAANPAPECEKLSITAEGCTNGTVTWTSNGQNYSTTQNHKIDFDIMGSQTSISARCKKSGFPETTANITVPTQLCIKANANPSSIEANRNTLVRITASGCSGTVSIKDMATGISEAMTAATKEVRLNGPRTYELTCQKEGYLPKTTTLRIDISVPLMPKGGESVYQEGTGCGSMGIINQKVCISGNCVENKDLNPLVYSNAGFSPGKYSFKAEASGCTTPIQWEWSDGTITKNSTQKAFEVFPNATGWLRLSCNGCTKSMAIYVNDPWECETFRLTKNISSKVEKNSYGESMIVYQNSNYCPSYKGVEWFSKSGGNLIDYLGSGPAIESKITKVYAVCEVNGTKCETMLNSTFGAAPPVTDLSSARVSSTVQLNTAAATTTSNCPADAAVSLQNAMAGYLSHLVCENIYLMGNEDGSFSEEKAALFYKSLKSSLTETYPTEAENFVFDVSETEAVALFRSQYTAKIADPSASCTTGDALAAGFKGETTMGNFENMREGYEDVENEIKNRILTLTNLNEIKKTFAKNANVKFTCQDEGVFGGDGTPIKIKTKEYSYQAEVIGCYDNAGSVFTFDSTKISFKGTVIEITSKENKEVKLRYTFADTTSEATMKYIVKWIKSKELEVTGKQLKLIFPGTSQARCDEVAKLINKYAEEYGLTSNERLAHFIGQIGAESNLSDLKEFYKYSSKDRIKEIFGKVKYCDLFEGYEADLSKCNGEKPMDCVPPLTAITDKLVIKDKYVNSQLLFDYTYSCRMDNGPATTGDGSRFRGRAFMHLTGRDKYTDLQTNWNTAFPNDQKDFLCDSDACEANRELLVTDLDFAMKSSLAFWKNAKANDLANNVTDNSIENVSKEVNGGSIGLSTRKSLTKNAYNILKNEKN